MLKSFDYVEYFNDNISVQDKGSFDQEKEIAFNYVRNYSGAKLPPDPPSCVCKGKAVIFFEKWGVSYYRCTSCGSVLANVSLDEVEYFKKCHELDKFRSGDIYQKNANRKREVSWEELIDWLRFRTYRYLGKKQVTIIDFGNRYEGLIQKLQNSIFCKEYHLRESILVNDEPTDGFDSKGDIILYLNNLQRSLTPVDDLIRIRKNLNRDGLLFFSTRIGTGFDVLSLREHSKIFPYEHVFLPSIEALEIIFTKAGYQILEVSTPGRLDAIYVKNNKDYISEGENFVRYLMDHADNGILQEFQRFLQRSNLSSYVQIVAKKMED